MRIAVVANEVQKNELPGRGSNDAVIEWYTDPAAIKHTDCCIDLLFEPDAQRVRILEKLAPALVVVNDMLRYDGIPSHFVRVNGWTTFLKRPVIEAAGSEHLHQRATALFGQFDKKVEWVPDIPGFVTPRIISMIINEAYFALGENVSTKEEIDIAMKLGTNYPYGPFEWAQKIGTKQIYDLLVVLSKEQQRYIPSPALAAELLNEWA